MRGLIGFFLFLFSFSLSAQKASPASGTLELSGSKLYYEVAGEGPAVVLIHGGQLDRRMWDEQFALFAKEFRVVRYDVRGYGNSPSPTEVYANEDDLAALLKHLKIEKAYIVGLSLGGRIAIDFALAHPEMTAGIVAVAPGLSGFNFTPDPALFASWHAAQHKDWNTVADIWLKTGYMAPAMKHPEIAVKVRQLALENAHEIMDNSALLRELQPPAIERLPDIKTPTLIVVGNLDVNDIHEICGLLYARIPHAGMKIIQNAGHMINMEQPQQFNGIVLEFLERQSHPVKMERR